MHYTVTFYKMKFKRLADMTLKSFEITVTKNDDMNLVDSLFIELNLCLTKLVMELLRSATLEPNDKIK